MPVFCYKGRNRRGEAVTGRIEATTARNLADQLTSLGIIPTKIEEESPNDDPLNKLQKRFSRGKIKTLDLIFFSRQMYTMLRAGVPIMQSLDGMLQTSTNPALISVIKGIRESLNAGLDLSRAVKSHSDVFSRLYISMIEVGETTGGLPQAFLSMANFLQQEKDIKDKVKSALRYPMIVIVAITIAMFVINIKVIPAFAGMFDKLGADLPLMTKIIMATSAFFTAYWHYLLVGIAGCWFGFKRFVKTANGHLLWDRTKTGLPIVGNIIRWSTLARFARALSITTEAGVPIVQALPVVGNALDNVFIESRVREMQGRIAQGTSITQAAEATDLFPPLVLQMLRIGEETGELDELIREVADFYEREVEYNVGNLSSVIEPILILVIGIMVLVIALGVFMPMWDLINVAKSG